MPLKIRFETIELARKNYPDARMARGWEAAKASLKGPITKTLKDAFEARVANWSHKPEFPVKFLDQVRQLRLDITSGGNNKRFWDFTTLGTKEHPITARRAPVLTVKRGYVPKTSPGNVYGGSGAYSGRVDRFKTVTHPGTKARKFEEHIVREVEDNIVRELSAAIERAMR